MRGRFGFQLLRRVLLSTIVVVTAVIGPMLVLADEADTGAKENRAPEPGALSSPDSFCRALAIAAAANELPIAFFTRLIWQESRFNPEAVSRAGAQGVAQFMPATAKWRGLADPFDPFAAIAASAQHLRDLNREFGNLGLAAAAYNAGPGRVRDWLAGRRTLPGETQAYVRIVTGHSAEEWTGGQKELPNIPTTNGARCIETVTVSGQPSSHAPAPRAEPIKPWGVELAGGPTHAKALAKYHELLVKYSAGLVLADREPHLVVRGIIGEMAAVRVRIDAETRNEGLKLCATLTARGWFCDVLRNLDWHPPG
jgi:hypothetical protein